MIDFWKAIITTVVERIFSWPVAIIVLALLFKRRISAVLARLTHLTLKHGETAFEAQTGDTAIEQTKGADVPKAGLLSAPAGEAAGGDLATNTAILPIQAATEPVDEVARQEMLDFGKNIAVVQAREEMIRTHLTRMHFELGAPETTEILIRNLAYNQAVAAAETLYRLIFGSQISLLKSLNTGPVKTDTEMREFYERAKRKFRKFYDNYSYEDWRGFLLHQGVIAHNSEQDVYGINRNGRDFLAWIAASGLSENKIG